MNALADPVHFSNLKMMARSAAHYRASIEYPKDTPAMRFGRLVHKTVLGGPPSELWEGERRGKAWTEFKKAHADVDIFTRTEVDEATHVANAILASPVAAPLLVGAKEHPLEWEVLGRKCATRGLDVVNGDTLILTDLKTTTCAEPMWFTRQALRMFYHAQMAWYRDAARLALGFDIQHVRIIAAEIAPPYAITVFRLTPGALADGEKLNRLWMERLLACEAANVWPGYVQSAIDLDSAEDFSLLIDGEEVAA